MTSKEQLEKALELACNYLVDVYNAPYDIPYDEPNYSKIYFKDGRAKYACKMTIQEWEEYLLSEVK